MKGGEKVIALQIWVGRDRINLTEANEKPISELTIVQIFRQFGWVLL